MNPTAFYDIETDGLGGPFVLGAIHHLEGARTEVYRWDDRDGERRMVEELAQLEGEVWAHNGGRYDHLWFLDRLRMYGLTRPIDIVANGQGIVRMRVDRASFMDSFRVFPMRLAHLTDGAKGNLEALCKCGEDCGGFCAIKRTAPRATLDLVADYCVGDVVELAHALDYFNASAETWGLKIGATVGSTAWKSAQAELELPPAQLPKPAWRAARAGYHGGRSELFRTRSAGGWACDVNAMYPAMLAKTPLPVGFRGVFYGRDARKAWQAGWPGIFRATVEVPEMFVPPLPVRVETGLAFPWGRITGSWPRPELEHALGLGCRLLSVHQAVAFERTELIFAPWVERLFGLRMRFGKESREGRWLKWVCNSLTGKLGSRAERHNLKLWPDLDQLRDCQCERSRCRCGAYRPMDSTGRAWISTMSMRKVEPCAHVEWAAYLTGEARVKLQRQLIAGGDDATYCDTDSCWSETERTEDIGRELGQWEPKGRYENFVALGPKTYRATLDGEETVAAKGIPDPEWEKIETGTPLPLRSIRGIRRARHGEPFFELVESTRHVTPNTGRRIPGPGDLTLPVKLED